MAKQQTGITYYRFDDNLLEGDVCKNHGLTGSEIDENFYNIRRAIVTGCEKDEESGEMYLTRADGDRIPLKYITDYIVDTVNGLLPMDSATTEEYEEKIDQIIESFEGIDEELTTLETTLTEQMNTLSEETQESVSRLSCEVTKLRGNISQLTADFTSYKNNTNGVIDDIYAKINDLYNKVRKINEEIRSIYSLIAKTRSDLIGIINEKVEYLEDLIVQSEQNILNYIGEIPCTSKAKTVIEYVQELILQALAGAGQSIEELVKRVVIRVLDEYPFIVRDVTFSGTSLVDEHHIAVLDNLFIDFYTKDEIDDMFGEVLDIIDEDEEILRELGESFTEHATNTDIHVTTAQTAYWDGKQDLLVWDDTPTEGSLNPVTSDGIYQAIGGNVYQIIKITYNDLVSLRNNSGLTPGQQYRIIDYETLTTQDDTISAGNNFDIIVHADNTYTLNEDARATNRDNDTYFNYYNSKLESWKLKYCIENDSNRFAWVDTVNGKGVIYYMKDEWGNECPYDFKNIKFKRYAVTDVECSAVSENALLSAKASFVYDTTANPVCFGHGLLLQSNYIVIDSGKSEYYYTFTWIDDETVTDASTASQFIGTGATKYGVKDNFIGATTQYDYDSLTPEGKTTWVLPNNVFVSTSLFNNGEFYGIRNNRLLGSCAYNTFGSNSNNNSLEEGCVYNLFGGNAFCNSLSKLCQRNVLSNVFTETIFGPTVSNSIFCGQNYSNRLDGINSDCVFGLNANNVLISNSSSNIIIGDENSKIEIGVGCNEIKFDYKYEKITVEGGNRNIYLKRNASIPHTAMYRNVKISAGCNTSSDLLTITTENEYNQTNLTVYQPSDTQVISV